MSSEAAASGEEQGLQNVDWSEAWARARATMDGVTRRRVSGGASGVEIALLDWGGEGELIVLHHATGFCAATWAPIALALSDRYRVVAVDARGHGDSTFVLPEGDPEAYHWSVLADDFQSAMKEILDFTGADRAKLALGHSFGGAVVLSVAQRQPEYFDHLLLCDPVVFQKLLPRDNAARVRESGLVDSTLRRRDRFPTREDAFNHFRSKGLFARFTPEALGLYVGEGMRDTSDGDVALKCSPRAEAAVFAGASLSDLFSEVEKITADTLFVHANQGNFKREIYDGLAERIPRARVESLEVGHLFPMDEPKRVVEIIEDLIAAD